ncbi:hypothetical protein CD155_11055 [Staphylococcus caprae]|nr:replication initiation protein [Staphylococcus caprae]POA02500.1 hypothetical protein CD155_11055 [Staphylococcus caprae]
MRRICKFIIYKRIEYTEKDRKKELTVSINPELKHILNEITGNFTKFELKEMTQLKSSYAKNMFRLLKQYKHTGHCELLNT